MQVMKIHLLCCFLFIAFCTEAQTNSPASNFTAFKINNDLKIDGVLNEPEWKVAQPLSGFKMNFPADTAIASSVTTVKLLYNSN